MSKKKTETERNWGGAREGAGGARKGAGRKPKGVDTKTYGLRCTAEGHAWLMSKVTASGHSSIGKWADAKGKKASSTIKSKR